MLSELRKARTPWWTQRAEELSDKLGYPAPPSVDEWGNEILCLDQLLIEGLEERWLRNKAQARGRSPTASLKSIKLLEECLIGCGVDPEGARSIVAPLHELHNLRSKLKGHASGEEAKEIRKKTLEVHGTYREHFKKLCGRCDESFRAIIEAINGDGKESET